ncbi:MAG TPA: surface-adhesin E family protein [Longimicrobium sp.]|nr:surface-adhesin E family protein [Longimicrobium sp.]
MPLRPLAAALLLSTLAAACSAQADARAGAASDDVARWFAGFRLGQAQREVMERARQQGILPECHVDTHFDLACFPSPPLDGPAREPDVGFAFKDGRLVSLTRSFGLNGARAPRAEVERVLAEAFGAPAVEGAANDLLDVKIWLTADSAILVQWTCGIPGRLGECDLGLDAEAGRELAPMVDYWRGAVARQARWRVVRRGREGTVAFDTQTLADRDGVRAVWVRSRLLAPGEPGERPRHDEVRTYVELDCAGGRFRERERIELFRGEELARRKLPGEWRRTAPESDAEAVLRAVCEQPVPTR